MAKAKPGLPDFTTMTLAERSKWLLAQLQKLPGKIVTDDAGRWLQLEVTGSLIQVLAELAPALTTRQLETSNRWLGEQRLRSSTNTGHGTYHHFIKLPDEAAGDESEAPAADTAGEAALEGEAAQVATAVPVLQRATQEIRELREALGVAQAQITRLTEINTTLERQLAEVAPLHDSLQELRDTLNAKPAD